MSEHEQQPQEQSAENAQEPEKVRPTHSVSFARILGQDERGKDVLGPARQVGSIWPRAGKDGDGILRLDHTPKEPGVFFTRKIDALRKDRGEAKDKEKDMGRER